MVVAQADRGILVRTAVAACLRLLLHGAAEALPGWCDKTALPLRRRARRSPETLQRFRLPRRLNDTTVCIIAGVRAVRMGPPRWRLCSSCWRKP
jgi:hypothetical protein